jgi:Peptidase inhibitor family I36
MTQTATLVRRSLGAVAAFALLAAAALLFASPERASAAYGTCGAGDFCLYYANNLTGGVYHFGGSDSNLDNDRFQGDTPTRSLATTRCRL